MRYPIFLSQIEKHIAQTIVEAFGQSVCGFDILRTKGFFPVVCDVNGWSFVKGNQKYYDDCADLIQSSFYEKLSAKMASNDWANNCRGPLRSTGVSLQPSGIHTLVTHGDPSASPMAAPIFRQAML